MLEPAALLSAAAAPLTLKPVEVDEEEGVNDVAAPRTLKPLEVDEDEDDVAIVVLAPVMFLFLSVGLRMTVLLKPS